MVQITRTCHMWDGTGASLNAVTRGDNPIHPSYKRHWSFGWKTGKQRASSYELLLRSLKADGLQAPEKRIGAFIFLLCWCEWHYVTFVCSAPNFALLGSLTCLRVGISVLQHKSATLLLFGRGKYKTEKDNNENRDVLLTSRQFAKNMNRTRVSRC